MTVVNFAGTDHENGSLLQDSYTERTLCEVLTAGTSYSFVFGGQGQNWYDRLPEILDSVISTKLAVIATDAEVILAPISDALLAARGYSVNFAKVITGTADKEPSSWEQGDAALGIPGTFAVQLAQLLRLYEHGFNWKSISPSANLGYSSGFLGAEYVQGTFDAPQLFALAQIIGAAAVRVARIKGVLGTPQASVMIAIGKINLSEIEAYLVEFIRLYQLSKEEAPVIAIYSHRSSVVVSGNSSILTKFRRYLLSIAETEEKERKNKLRGGRVFAPTFQDVPVNVPYHHPGLADVIDQVVLWADTCGLNTAIAAKLADVLIVSQLNWINMLDGLDSKWIIDLGPNDTLTRINKSLVAGRGIGLVAIDTHTGFGQFFKDGAFPQISRRWSNYQPSVSTLPNGQLIVNTAFTKLTGRSPILLAGMTPTTVDPAIVAAAANAGHWAELAGGGQVTETVFAGNLDKLEQLLEPGRAIQFNSLYLDPYLWGLQLGSKRMVQRARNIGVPIDGVVVSAGIPEKTEAIELIHELNKIGIHYIAFKPGTIKQIKDVIAIAQDVAPTPVIVHIEGGKAGGHHSWEDLDDLLLGTYPALRTEDNIIICVGGGIGNSQIAGQYLMGSWVRKYGNYQLMPVDGILIGTIAMAACEATTSLQVKELLVHTAGGSQWVGSGESAYGVTSSISQLGADLHEIDNSWARCGRLLDKVAGNAQAVNKYREKIIAALNTTAKPYFGDISTMTYGQLLERVIELMFGTAQGPYWLDPTWQDRFHNLITRIQARVHDQESGKTLSLFADDNSTDDAYKALGILRERYPEVDAIYVHPADQQYFVELCAQQGKPVPFVPVIDSQVRKWWRSDSLWQAHDTRYPADAVSILPGPASLAGITKIDEPIADILGGIEQDIAHTILDTTHENPLPRCARRDLLSDTPAGIVFSAPDILWHRKLTTNPVIRIAPLKEWKQEDADNFVHETTGTRLSTASRDHALLTIPTTRSEIRLKISVSNDGKAPAVSAKDAAQAMRSIFVYTDGSLKATPSEKPSVTIKEAFDPATIVDHSAVTTPLLPDHLQPHAMLHGYPAVPDVFIAVSWRAMITALTSIRTSDGELLASELINLVHLDHSVRIVGKIPTEPTEVITHAELTDISDTGVGKVVTLGITISQGDGFELVTLQERFAFRGFVGTAELVDPPRAGGALGQQVIDGARKKIRQVTVTAPSSMHAYAAVSRDYNPIHTDYAVARFAGLDSQIVHGMWLSSIAARIATSQDISSGVKPTQRLIGWTARFLGMVKPDEHVVIRVDRVGIEHTQDIIEVSARVDGILVMSATGFLAAPFTALVFPGQGIQRQGMGLDALARSKAVREIWERADKHTREVLGFSILVIVRDNPTSVVIDGVTYQHPEGVLFLTQFTQVAMSVLAQAQIAELGEAGLFDDMSVGVTCGHSVGEYNALTAVSGVIKLESLIEIVYHRGLTMHNLVPRNEKGVSNYQMAAIRPAQIGLEDDDVFDFVEDLAEESGEFLQIVNYNIRGSQYAVAGTVKGIGILEEEVEKRRARYSGRPAFIRVSGLDVPFHSRELYSGVADFRAMLNKIITEVNVDYITGRYIPNLVPRPFSIERDFIEEIVDLVDSEPLKEVLRNYDKWRKKPNDLTKEILVELLAWQFASPVRWIETQDLLFTPVEHGGYGVQRYLEVGVAISPTLTNMARHTLQLPMFSDARVEVLNFERDHAIIWGQDTVAEDDDEDASITTTETSIVVDDKAPVVESVSAIVAVKPAQAASGVNAARSDDIIFNGGDALATLISSWTTMRPDQISPTDTIESITDGASSRRNQLLIDLGAELNITSIDGAADAAIPVLQKQLAALAKNYKPFGAVISELIVEQTRKIFGPAGKRASYITERVTKEWQLGQGWAKHVSVAIALGTREGTSVRGGELGNLGSTPCKDPAAVNVVIDKAVEYVAQHRGINVSLPNAEGVSAGTIDIVALREFTDQIIGDQGVLAEAARVILRKLDLLEEEGVVDEEDLNKELADLVTQELGSDWVRAVTPRFSAQQAIIFDDRWASAREDLARLWIEDCEKIPQIIGAGEIVANQALWWAQQADKHHKSDLADVYRRLAQQASSEEEGAWSDDIAVITGASDGSIAAAVTAQLLAGGATVIATTSQLDNKRREFFRKLYHSNAAYDAKLWVLPANMSSYSDIDDLVHWIATDDSRSLAGQVIFSKPPMYPTLLFPFAAPRVIGDMSDAGPRAEVEMRVLLWSVERLITKIGAIGADINLGVRLHVVLPGSPNRGMFGGDGAYGEAKASLDAVIERYKSEKSWNERITLAHAIIGWVRGTGLMGKNSAVEEAVQELGVKTFSTDEIAVQLLGYADKKSREQAHIEPLVVDLTGGLTDIDIDIAALAKAAQSKKVEEEVPKDSHEIGLLPSPVRPWKFPRVTWPRKATAKLEETVVIVGVGEVGPYGSSRTRYEIEVYDELSIAGIAELAWLTGLMYWDNGAQAGWYDSETNIKIDELEIADRYRDKVMANAGVRKLLDSGRVINKTRPIHEPVFLDEELSFVVSDEAMARTFLVNDPENTIIVPVPNSSDWKVVRKPGTEIFVTRRIDIDRFNAGQVPEHFDPCAYGISADMANSIDRLTLWNIVATVDAFISSGFDPVELLRSVHPADIANTQGTGMGGTSSIRKLYLHSIFGQAAPNDILQESLPNVVSAHIVQSYIGSYGAMVHPVAACATAAVSLEEGVDKILAGKADFAVTGGYDDISLEGIVGFADMSATADSVELEQKGIDGKHASRANDRRRAGFVESQGGGTVLLARGDVALKMGLPVRAVVAYAQSFGDGVHTSIPAPGLGALAAARGRQTSKLNKSLQSFGLTADDITVVSKHDTSTLINDVNETHLHEYLAKALGRSEGNPLFVVSQKTVTGHAKGGAAAFQIIGLSQILENQIIPPNRNLDCVDDRLDDSEYFVWLRETYPIAHDLPIRAGIITSLGFGHVSGLIVLAHPEAFLQLLSEKKREAYLYKAQQRVTEGRQRLVEAMYGGRPLYERPVDRRFDKDTEREDEISLLLSEKQYLDHQGYF